MFHIAICDDDLNIHELLQYFLRRLAATTAYTFDIRCFSSGEELIQHYNVFGAGAFHILILDIEMKGMNGINTAKYIRSLPDHDVHIMFLTSYPEYLLDSFDVHTFQYLFKPISYERFSSKTALVCDYILTSITRFFCIKTEKEQVVLRNSEIIAIVKIKQTLVQNKLKIITTRQEYIVTGKLLEYANKLGDPFLQIHRSIIINLEHIRKFSSVAVEMSNHDHFPIGRSRARDIKNTYARYMIAHFKE